MIPDDLLSIPEVAQLLQGKVHDFSVRRWIAKGVGNPPVKLKGIRLGRNYFVSRRDLREFLENIADPAQFRKRRKTERGERAKRRLIEAGA